MSFYGNYFITLNFRCAFGITAADADASLEWITFDSLFRWVLEFDLNYEPCVLLCDCTGFLLFEVFPIVFWKKQNFSYCEVQLKCV